MFLYISECQNYASLNSADRKITYTRSSYYCDNGIGPGWFRFEGSAGTRMPTSCPPVERCNTYSTGWLNGGHPTVADGLVTRTVCFTIIVTAVTANVSVRNCGSYYVYYLSGTPNNYCYLRHCGTS